MSSCGRYKNINICTCFFTTKVMISLFCAESEFLPKSKKLPPEWPYAKPDDEVENACEKANFPPSLYLHVPLGVEYWGRPRCIVSQASKKVAYKTQAKHGDKWGRTECAGNC